MEVTVLREIDNVLQRQCGVIHCDFEKAIIIYLTKSFRVMFRDTAYKNMDWMFTAIGGKI